MNQTPYPFTRNADRYIFVRKGNTEIVKMVDFTSMENPNIFNLCFGDLTLDGQIDDFVISNNGDMKRVLATVIYIAADFLIRNPKASLHFTGSTITRTSLYQRILKTYYKQLSAEFAIFASIKSGNRLKQVKFNPDSRVAYTYFLITKKY